jgi:hypothetical protein
MPRYKLILQDAAGKSRSATVEAGSQAEAVDLSRRKGYQVRQIEAVYDLEGDDEPPAPVETAEHGYGYDPPPRPARRPPSNPPTTPGPPLMPVAVALSGLALLVAVGTLGYVLFRGTGKTESTEGKADPVGTGLAGYDFSTATRAMESEARMESKLDVRARMEFDRKTREARAQEKADTTRVHREADYHGAKVVFYSYKEKGETRYRTQGYEKHEESGLWVKKSIAAGDVEGDDPTLAGQMRDWEKNGPGKPKDPTPGKK